MLAVDMPPNYRQQQGQPLALSERKGALVLAAGILVCGLGLGSWELTNGFGSGSAQKCVDVVVGSATGGGELHECGGKARTWCHTESTAPGALRAQVVKACRQSGFLPA
jgi:hypothetical protein